MEFRKVYETLRLDIEMIDDEMMFNIHVYIHVFEK